MTHSLDMNGDLTCVRAAFGAAPYARAEAWLFESSKLGVKYDSPSTIK